MPNATLIMDEPQLTVMHEDRMLVRIHATGEIEYGEGYAATEAAQAFWAAMMDVLPEHAQQFLERVKELKNEPDDPIAAYDRAMRVIGRP